MTESKTSRTITKTIDADAQTLTIATVGQPTIRVNLSQIPAAMIAQAALHGLSQKIGDAAAIERNPDTGRSATAADKYAAMHEVWQRLMAGEWNKRAEGGTATKGGYLFRALCIVYEGSRTPEQITAWLATKTAKEQAALRGAARIAAVIEELKAADAKNPPPTDEAELFAGLE